MDTVPAPAIQLVSCPACSNSVSPKATACPKCGHPLVTSSQATEVDRLRYRRELESGWERERLRPGHAGDVNVQSVPHVDDAGAVLVVVRKSRGVYIALGILLGGLGIHNFYAGRYGPGAFQCVLTLCLAACSLPLLAIVGVWVVIELFTVTTDGAGNRMA
jgi:TM2 domain-containing membrane protein YozV